jgi:hypothetical protein
MPHTETQVKAKIRSPYNETTTRLSTWYHSILRLSLGTPVIVYPERQPLIQPSPSPGVPRPSLASENPPRHSSGDLHSYQTTTSSSRSVSFIRPVETSSVLHSSDKGLFCHSIMEKVKRSKVAHYANKLAVQSEPNLTTAQLMLFNHDLKPACSPSAGA